MRLFSLIILLAVAAPAVAQDGLPQHPPKGILQGPSLTADEQTKIRFSANASNSEPPAFNFRFYNGLLDKTIIGLVVTVSTKDRKGDVDQTDVFVSINCPPLDTVAGSDNYFLNFGNAPSDVSFTLKQVLYQPGAGKASK